jgi:fructuronate reductase
MTCFTARLSPETLGELPAGVARPRYDRAKVSSGILHLGLGAFHRAHQAVYTDAVLDRDPTWGITGVSPRSAAVRDRLAPQQGLYSVIERGASGTRASVVGAVLRMLVLAEDFGEIVRAFADPRTRIVSLTVTEKGYCHDPATLRLAADHPGLAHDYAQPDRPQTTIGLLVAGLGIRRLAGTGPVTVLCCDNLPGTGRTVEALVREYAGRVDPKLGPWVGENVAFPGTMVDRRVPEPTAADLDDASARLGLRDEAAVVCEPFSQWVIEDRFARGRPAWDAAGATFVADVAPYEALKLRLVNGGHSAIAYLGSLAGFDLVSEAMREPSLVAFVRRLLAEEATPTLQAPAGVDLAAYREQVLERFASPALRFRCAQICMDGSQKLPQRLLATARARLAAGESCDHVALAVAGWMRYVTGVDERGAAIDVRDPLAARLAAIGRDAGPAPAALAAAYLGVREVFGDDLPHAPAFAGAVTRWLERLYRHGAKATLESHYRPAP